MPLMTTYRLVISWPGSPIICPLSKETNSALSTTSAITSLSSPLSHETPIRMLVGLGGLMEAEELCNFLILKANICTHDNKDVAVTFMCSTHLQEFLLIDLFYQAKVM